MASPVTATQVATFLTDLLGAMDMAEAMSIAEQRLTGMTGAVAILKPGSAEDQTGDAVLLRDTNGTPIMTLRFDGEVQCGADDLHALVTTAEAAFAGVIQRDQLARDSARYADFTATASDWLWESDADHRFTDFSEARAIKLRQDGLPLIGRTRWEVAKGNPAHGIWQAHKATLDKREPFKDFHYSLVDEKGRTRHFVVGGRPLHDRGGRFAGYRGTAADVTARHVAEAERERALRLARASDERLRRFVESSADVICLTDRSGRFVEVSQSARDVWGFAPEELIGRRFAEFMHPDDVVMTLERRQDFLFRENLCQFHNRYRHKNGRSVHMHWSTTWSETDELCFSIARDVTDRVHGEQRLRHAQRIEAIGQLTGSVAHDFNNLLTVILGNAELLVELLHDRDDLRQLAEMVGAAATRGADLTGSLLAFARRQTLQPRDIDSRMLLQRLSGMLKRLLGERIKIDMTLPHELWPTQVDAAQLETAIVNLAINARDAMPNGGVLVIEAGNVRIGQPDTGSHIPAGEWLLIQIADTGTGMTEDVAKLAFEPFFTTKEAGQGSGLGLSMVHGFVRQSGGHVQLQSAPDAGTIVQLFLPRGTAPQPVAEPRSEPMPGGSERILLVEDDASVRENAVRLLGDLGYQVTVASNGLQALTILEDGAPFDLLFTDAVMPGGVDGVALGAAATRLRPDLPVLLTTGYVDMAERTEKDPFRNLIRKPYRRQELAMMIRGLLDRQSTTMPALRR